MEKLPSLSGIDIEEPVEFIDEDDDGRATVAGEIVHQLRETHHITCRDCPKLLLVLGHVNMQLAEHRINCVPRGLKIGRIQIGEKNRLAFDVCLLKPVLDFIHQRSLANPPVAHDRAAVNRPSRDNLLDMTVTPKESAARSRLAGLVRMQGPQTYASRQ